VATFVGAARCARQPLADPIDAIETIASVEKQLPPNRIRLPPGATGKSLHEQTMTGPRLGNAGKSR
jgi:hypothetical protein